MATLTPDTNLSNCSEFFSIFTAKGTKGNLISVTISAIRFRCFQYRFFFVALCLRGIKKDG